MKYFKFPPQRKPRLCSDRPDRYVDVHFSVHVQMNQRVEHTYIDLLVLLWVLTWLYQIARADSTWCKHAFVLEYHHIEWCPFTMSQRHKKVVSEKNRFPVPSGNVTNWCRTGLSCTPDLINPGHWGRSRQEGSSAGEVMLTVECPVQDKRPRGILSFTGRKYIYLLW